jgi:hypothetical protein
MVKCSVQEERAVKCPNAFGHSSSRSGGAVISHPLQGNYVVQSVHILPRMFIQTVGKHSSCILKVYYLRSRDKIVVDLATAMASTFRLAIRAIYQL